MTIDFQISSLQELLDYLPNCHPAEYKPKAKYMELPASDFGQYATWNKDRYTRNCIVRTDKYELILLCWDTDQATSIHCHGGEECWVYNLQGKIEEVHFELENGVPEAKGSHQLAEGKVSYMNDDLGYHQLFNVGEGRAMSLHLYMNPIDHCTSWNKELGAFVPVDLKYDTYQGKPV